jgi:hypothetical protein
MLKSLSHAIFIWDNFVLPLLELLQYFDPDITFAEVFGANIFLDFK